MEGLTKFDDMRDDLFQRALDQNEGHVHKAADAIGVHYATLYRWLQKRGCARRPKSS